MKQKVHPAIVQALRPAKRRIRLYHAAQYAGTGVLAACASCAALAGVSYFVPIPRLPLFMALAALSLFSLSVLAGLLRPVSNELAARRADAGGLHERALTALRQQNGCGQAAVIGRVSQGRGSVFAQTRIGTYRRILPPTGELLPRIC